MKSDSNFRKAVESWPWNGSWFPEDDCFEALKEKFAPAQYPELRKAIKERAQKFNAQLE